MAGGPTEAFWLALEGFDSFLAIKVGKSLQENM